MYATTTKQYKYIIYKDKIQFIESKTVLCIGK